MTGGIGVTVFKTTGGILTAGLPGDEQGESYKFYTAIVKLFIRFTSA